MHEVVCHLLINVGDLPVQGWGHRAMTPVFVNEFTKATGPGATLVSVRRANASNSWVRSMSPRSSLWFCWQHKAIGRQARAMQPAWHGCERPSGSSIVGETGFVFTGSPKESPILLQGPRSTVAP
jgi:hypothetical protein